MLIVPTSSPPSHDFMCMGHFLLCLPEMMPSMDSNAPIVEVRVIIVVVVARVLDVTEFQQSAVQVLAPADFQKVLNVPAIRE